MSKDRALAHAFDLLERIPLVDGHNDLPYVIRADRDARGDVGKWDPSRAHQDHDTDIPRLKEGKLSAQFWAAFIPTHSPHPGRTVMEVLDVILQMEERYPDVFLPARRASDILRAKRLGKIASFLTVEGGVGLENSLSPLRIWRAAGMRLMTLCHNETLDWVDSATDASRHGGLTRFGEAVVLELNRLGVIVDLAHVAPSVMRQVLGLSRAPVVFSHSNAFALCDHPRNVPDDVLDLVKPNGALVMATFVPTFISQDVRDHFKPLSDPYGKAPPVEDAQAVSAPSRRTGAIPPATLEQLCDHIQYIAQRTGPNHLGIGSDFYGGRVPVGLENVSRFPHLLAELIRRGWSDDAIAGISGLNFLRVFRKVEATGRRLRASEPPRVGRIEDFS
ncbi:dipeptidase [Alsobacter metallidurans]|uniref:Dipeptidase n=1 Tax=Alsobacter metallidurans TaxID=340221 RepID=A0A917I9N6_9HYPH|nr:dipeptidase [Alsobacter metallidurans]GGH28122.1 dipeptidase [Alsobacter metallidurans]